MRFFDWLTGPAAAVTEAEEASFAVDAASVVGLTSTGYANTPARAPRMDRATAMQVPAVKRSRDLVCPSSGALPLRLRGPDGAFVPWSLFDQPERNVPRSVTMTRLFEDLLFEEIAWWDVVEIGYHTYPAFVKRLAPHRVTVNGDTGKVYVDGVERANPERTLIRFDSPNDGLLTAGARAIRTCLMLDAAAANIADGIPPTEYFTPAEGMDPGTTDEEIVAMLDRYQQARRMRSAAYMPHALDYHSGQGFNAEQLQLAESRQHAVLEIARVAGVDPEELGVSTTSRTYSSDWSRRKSFLDFTLGPYLTAVSDRLLMPDTTPRGYTPGFDLDAFLRTDTLTRYQTYAAGLEIRAITEDEMRAAEGKAPLASPAPAPLRSLPTPTSQENAS